MDKKAIVAAMLGCKPQELMSYKDFGTFVSVVDPVGRKFVYTNEHLQDAAQRSELAVTKSVATAKKDAAPPAPDSKKPAKPPAKKSVKGQLPKTKKIAVPSVTPQDRPSATPQDKSAKKTVTGSGDKERRTAKKIATTKTKKRTNS